MFLIAAMVLVIFLYFAERMWCLLDGHLETTYANAILSIILLILFIAMVVRS